MQINNPTKALILLVALICITLLMILKTIDSQAATGLLGMIVGYCIGNGIAAKNSDEVTPVFTKKGEPHNGSKEEAI